VAEKLRILCCNPDGGAFFYITKGWENAFKALGHDFVRWKGDLATLEKYKPHLYLGCSGWRQKFPVGKYDTKIGIHVNPWGSTVLKPEPREPDINEPAEARKWTLAQKPDFVYCYGGAHDIPTMWNLWQEKTGIPVVPMPTGGDAVVHKPVNPDSKYVCDVGFVGGYWPYKAMNIDKFLTPVIKKYNSRVYGWGGWKHIGNKSKGPIEDHEVNKLFSSAKICPAISEPHTIRYGIDIPERIWKVPLGGGFTISDPVKNLDKYISYNDFITARNPQEYANLIAHYLPREEARKKLAKRQRLAVLKDHTYFSRIQGFLRQCGFDAEADEAQRMVDKLVKEAENEVV